MQAEKRQITVFDQFGFREAQHSGKHSIGNCPFCGSDKHFFVNKESENKAWDCKRCGRSGGYKKFIEEIVEVCSEIFSKDKEAVKHLIDSRGLLAATFNDVRVGYHPATKQYLLPVFSVDGKQILNIKLYDGKTMRNVSGATAAMYGIWREDELKNSEDILICEGEWDTLTMLEIIKKAKIKNTTAVGVPGAGTFKTDCLPIFQDKNIYLMYDNDEAGTRGMDKAAGLLASVTRKVMRLHWPEGFPEGFDVRDFYRQNNCNAVKTWEGLLGWVKPAELPKATSPTAASEIVDIGEPVPCEKVYAAFKKWLHIPDLTLLDVIFGTILANRLSGDPLWMFIVAPPGATKTEPLLGLTGGVRIETISTLTPHTLISGANFGGGGDPSLIPRLDSKVLIIKDFTSVLGLPSTERDEIFSILRDAYDGECSKPFGNGIWRRYKSKFGILAAVTPSIELFTEDHAALGERFLRWRNWIPKSPDARRKYIEKALSNATHEDEMRKDLGDISKMILKAKYTNVPIIPAAIGSKIVGLAQLVSLLRGTVVRDKYTRSITHKSFTELGTRISKQLDKLIRGVAMFRGNELATDYEYNIACRVARSSVPHRLYLAVEYLYTKKVKQISATELSKEIGLPNDTCTIILDNLTMLDVMERTESGQAYRLSKDTLNLLDKSDWI
jgi:hypothetical protein